MIFTDTMAPLLFAALTFLAISLLLLGILQYLAGAAHKRALKDRLRNDEEALLSGEKGGPLEDGPRPRLQSLARFLRILGERRLPADETKASRIRQRLHKAGLRFAHAPAILWGSKILFAILLPACFLLTRITVLKVFSPSVTIAVLVLLCFVGLYLPEIWLLARISRRKNKIFKGFPDALDLMIVCLEAGMGLDAALSRVGEEIKLSCPELSDEIRVLTLEIRAGKSRQAALKDFAARIDLDEVKGLVLTMHQSERFGTSVVQALKTYSDSFRTERIRRAEEQAGKIPVKLIFPLVFCLFPGVFVILVGPPLIKIYLMFIQQ